METQESSGSGGFFGLLGVAVAVTGAAVANVWRALTRDGTLAAAWRQGADEVAVALRPFPESIQVDEPGTILNPTQGEIAASRKPLVQPLRPANASLPTPSEIAKDKQPYVPEQTQEHGHERGRG